MLAIPNQSMHVCMVANYYTSISLLSTTKNYMYVSHLVTQSVWGS